MAPKPKLEYDAKVPAFLQRLKGHYAESDGRSTVQQARARKDLIGHDDDGPTYVDEESGDIVSKEEFEKAAVEESVDNSRGDSDLRELAQSSNSNEALLDQAAPGRSTASVEKAVFGSSSKRKAARVIGDEDDDAPRRDQTGNNAESQAQTGEKRTKKTAKRGKKIKLSFLDDKE